MSDIDDSSECERCGGTMSAADDAECQSAKCAGFRAFAEEHHDDPEGDAW